MTLSGPATFFDVQFQDEAHRANRQECPHG